MTLVHGGRLVAQALRRQGVQHVFTLCGAHIQAIYDGCIDEGIRVVDTRHEQTAGHAAEAVARLTGQPGVVLVNAGPGTTSVVTALANAKQAGSPLVCIGGTGPRELSHMGSFQDFESETLLRPLTKWSARVSAPERLMEYVDTAFNRASAGSPGPVYLEIPVDVLMAFAEDTLPRTAPQLIARPAPSETQLLELTALLKRSGKPVFLIGSQFAGTADRTLLERLCDRLEVPIYLNGLAKGALPEDHPCAFARTRKEALRQADLIVLCGTPFDFRVEYGRPDVWNPDATVVQVNVEAEALGHNRSVDLAIHADTAAVLEGLDRHAAKKSCPEWSRSLRELEQEHKSKLEAELGAAEGKLTALRLAWALARHVRESDLFVADGGDFPAQAGAVLPVRWPGAWLDAGPFGTQGVGPGYAMAAASLRPDQRTVLLSGDAAFGCHALEFEAMVRHGLSVVAVIGNDAGWSATRRSQAQLYGSDRAVASGLSPSRYEAVVAAMGGAGYWVEKESELEPALKAAFAGKVPACVNVRLERPS